MAPDQRGAEVSLEDVSRVNKVDSEIPPAGNSSFLFKRSSNGEMALEGIPGIGGMQESRGNYPGMVPQDSQYIGPGRGMVAGVYGPDMSSLRDPATAQFPDGSPMYFFLLGMSLLYLPALIAQFNQPAAGETPQCDVNGTLCGVAP
jgi:hypothetical protein